MAAGQAQTPFDNRVAAYAEKYNLSVNEAEDVVAYQDAERDGVIRVEFVAVRERLYSLCDGTTRSRERAMEYIRDAESGKRETADEELVSWWMTRYDQLEASVMERSALLKKEARDALRKVRVALRAPFDIKLDIDVTKLRVEAKKFDSTSIEIWSWAEYPKEKTGLLGPDSWY